MSSRKSNRPIEYGPLGPGHAPEKDPLKGLRGVMAGILSMESISLLLVLTVILRVNDGAYWTTFNWVYVTAVGVAHMILAFATRARWALTAIWALQAAALIGVIVHVSMGIIALIFIAVWGYVFYLRRNIMQRMERGYLASQHT